MNFEIPAEIYVRLANVTKRIPDDDGGNLGCVRLENRNGDAFAISTNRRIAAVYYLGKSKDGDGFVHVTNDDVLINQCVSETPFSSILHITAIPELQMASAKTTYGYNYPGNAGVFPPDARLNDWRNLAPATPIKKTNGAMSWTLDDMLSLNSASMSGKLAFPEFIDVRSPVIVRDIEYPNWLGVFMPTRREDGGKSYAVEAATVPAWWK